MACRFGWEQIGLLEVSAVMMRPAISRSISMPVGTMKPAMLEGYYAEHQPNAPGHEEGIVGNDIPAEYGPSDAVSSSI